MSLHKEGVFSSHGILDVYGYGSSINSCTTSIIVRALAYLLVHKYVQGLPVQCVICPYMLDRFEVHFHYTRICPLKKS